MSPRITHSKVSGKPNPTDASKVGGEDWDADHVIDGLTIGTDVQAHDATLDALAGLTTAANKLPYFTNADVAAVTDLSAFGRSLIDDADAATARATLGLASVPREVLTANRTYYVRTDGSDSNTGLANTAGGAFLTIQKAIDTAVALDLGIYSVTINVADGTYTGAVVLKAYVGVGPIYITGNTGTPSNVVISTTGASAIAGYSCGSWTIGGVKVQTATAGYGVYIQGGTSIVTLNKVDFGVVGGVYSHIQAALGASITIIGNYTISGNSGDSHYYAIENGVIIIGAVTVTLSGTPTYQRFALAYMAGLIRSAATFSGSGTGVRYLAIKTSSFEVYGAGANYFPGNSAGSADATSSYS